MTTPRLLQDIAAQADSLAQVLKYQFGEGKPVLREAAALLRSRPRVVITGIGASQYASIPFENELCARGHDATVIETGELLHYRGQTARGAVVVMVSRSGESVETIKLLETLKGTTPIIGVSNEPSSVLAKDADVNLQIGSPVDEAVAVRTYVGTILTLYLLACAASDAFESARDEVEALLPGLQKLAARDLEGLGGWDAFLQGGGPVHLLARGPSYATALEGSLLFNEVAKAPAVAMPAASFRHGPVEVVDASFRGLVFAPAGATRDLNVALAENLTRFGGGIRGIGPRPSTASICEWCETPMFPEMLAPLAEIVPVQCAAVRLAQLKGICLGSFKFTAHVTRDESVFLPREPGTS
jgi:glucosamine--fructose-6-phosphate aminotransferase (isomerizing)